MSNSRFRRWHRRALALPVSALASVVLGGCAVALAQDPPATPVERPTEARRPAENGTSGLATGPREGASLSEIRRRQTVLNAMFQTLENEAEALKLEDSALVLAKAALANHGGDGARGFATWKEAVLGRESALADESQTSFIEAQSALEGALAERSEMTRSRARYDEAVREWRRFPDRYPTEGPQPGDYGATDQIGDARLLTLQAADTRAHVRQDRSNRDAHSRQLAQWRRLSYTRFCSIVSTFGQQVPLRKGYLEARIGYLEEAMRSVTRESRATGQAFQTLLDTVPGKVDADTRPATTPALANAKGATAIEERCTKARQEAYAALNEADAPQRVLRVLEGLVADCLLPTEGRDEVAFWSAYHSIDSLAKRLASPRVRSVRLLAVPQ